MKGIAALLMDPGVRDEVSRCWAELESELSKIEPPSSPDRFLAALGEVLGNHLRQGVTMNGWSAIDQLLVCARVEDGIGRR